MEQMGTVNIPNVGHSPKLGQHYFCNSVISIQDHKLKTMNIYTK